jgi:tRNA G46 methylase TrmB
MQRFPTDLLSVELVDLGSQTGGRFHNIYQPAPEVDGSLQGVTAQFLENADTYHKKYLNYGRFEHLIKRALKEAAFDCDAPTVLDIGSGSGNSVIPLMKLFPASTIVACDISPNMLAILRDH